MVWLGTAAAIVVSGFIIDLPRSVYLNGVGFSLFLAAYRGIQAFKVSWTKAQLAGRGVVWLDAAELHRRVKAAADNVFLGWGFDWERKHTQLVYELKKTGMNEIMPPAWFMQIRNTIVGEVGTHQRGAEWIHGLEPKESEIHVPLRDMVGGCLLFGTTGSGKTRILELLATQAIHASNTAVIFIDPKGDRDIRERLHLECIRAGRPEAFMHFHPAHPSLSVRFDPLANWSRPTEIASRIAGLLPSESGNDAFRAFGWRAINQVVQALVEVEDRPNLMKIRRYIEGGPDKLLEAALTAFLKRTYPGDWEARIHPYLARADKGDYNKERPSKSTPSRVMGLLRFYKEEVPEEQRSSVVDGLMSLFEHERVHAMKLIASLLPLLSKLTSGDLGKLLSPDGNDPDDNRPILNTRKIVESRSVLYVGLDALSDADVAAAIGQITLADLAAVAGHIYNYQTVNVQTYVFVDEAAEVTCQQFVQLLNKGRGSGLNTVFAAQSLPDFVARTGDEAMARMILANANNLIALRTKDRTTQDFIVESLGKVPIYTGGVSHDTGAIVNRDPTNYSGSYSERKTETEVDVFSYDLLGRLPDLHYIASTSGKRYVKGRIPLLTKERGPRLEEMVWAKP